MKIAIAGCGRVGTVIAEKLIKEHHDIIVIDKSEETIDVVSNSLDVLPVIGDAASAELLMEAGVSKCDLLIAVTDADAANLLICIVAKKIGVANTIARIRDPIYSETINLIKEDMGLSFIVNPERDTAKEILSSLLFKGAGQVETFAKGNYGVMTFVVKEKNPICGIEIKNLSKFINRRILICAIKRENKIFIPNGTTVIELNDTISFVASRPDAVHFFRKMNYETGKIADLTIIGGNRLAFYLANMALSNGIPVKLIEENAEKCRHLNDIVPGAEVLCGDATDTAILEESGVFSSSAVATMTGYDETNVLVSMFITKNCPHTKVITTIQKSDFEDMLYGIDMGNVFNPKYIAADRIITYVRAMQETGDDEVQSICHVIDNKVEVLEFKIDVLSSQLSTPLQNIKFKENILLAAINRNGEAFIPGGNDTMELGDTILVVTTTTGIRRFKEIFV